MKIKRTYYTFLLVMFLLSSVSALGITPARTSLDFSPGAERTISFSIINNEKEDSDLIIYAGGELNESILFKQNKITLSASEESKQVEYTLKMPQNLEPGLRIGEINVLKIPKQKEGELFIGAALGVVSQVHVYVPYPGKYADVSLDVYNDKQTNQIIFVSSVISRGNLDLSRVRANIDIYTSLGEKIESLNSDPIEILSGQKKEISLAWASKFPSGKYRAVLTLIYDEQTKTIEKFFNIGDSMLELQQIEVKNFQLGEIAKFEMLVENRLAENVSGAYAQTNVFNNEGQIIADFKSPTYEILPLEKKIMVLYWDTAGLKKGIYDAMVSIKYGLNFSSQKEVQFEVLDNKINVVGLGYVISERNGSNLGGNTMLYMIIGFLVLINILWFLVLRNKLFSKSETKVQSKKTS